VPLDTCLSFGLGSIYHNGALDAVQVNLIALFTRYSAAEYSLHLHTSAHKKFT
jgi:hypothetical protein